MATKTTEAKDLTERAWRDNRVRRAAFATARKLKAMGASDVKVLGRRALVPLGYVPSDYKHQVAAVMCEGFEYEWAIDASLGNGVWETWPDALAAYGVWSEPYAGWMLMFYETRER